MAFGRLVTALMVGLVACSSAETTPSSPGASPKPGGPSNQTSTMEQRNELCNLGVPKCKSYESVGACITDHKSAAECFVVTVTSCVRALDGCVTDDYDACMQEGANACDPESIPSYVTDCREKNRSCKPSYPAGEADAIQQNVDDSCFLLPALDASGRAAGAACLSRDCAELETCLVELTP